MPIEPKSIWMRVLKITARDRPNVTFTTFEPIVIIDSNSTMIKWAYLNEIGIISLVHETPQPLFLRKFRPADPHEIVKLRKLGALDKFRQSAILNV